MSNTYYGTLDSTPINFVSEPGQAFPMDREGTLVELDALPPGTSVDNIFYFNSPNSGKFLSRVIDGTIRAAYVGVSPANSGIVNQTRLNAAFSNAGINEIIVDFNAGAEILISGTVNCQNKVLKFRRGNTLINDTSGGLQNVLLDGGKENYHIDSGLTLTNVSAVRKTLSPEWFGAKGDAINDDAIAIQKYLSVAVSLNGGIIEFPARKTYYIKSDVVLPNFNLGNISQCIINGNGSTLMAVGNNRVILKKIVANQADAEVQINSRLLISHMNFLGDNSSTQKGLLIQATYGSTISHCSFKDLTYGVDLQFCLNASTFQNYFSRISQLGITARSGTWSGASSTNSQSNQTIFRQDRHFVAIANQACCVEVRDSSNCDVRDCIFEGNENPVNNIVYYALTTSTSKSFFVTHPHIENTPTDCSILVSPVGGIVLIDGIWSQTSHVLVAVTDNIVANGDIIIRNLVHLPGSVNLFRQPNATYNKPNWYFENWPTFAPALPASYFISDLNNRLPFYLQYQKPSGQYQNIYTNYFESVGLRIQSNGNILMTALNTGSAINDDLLTISGTLVRKITVPGGIGVDKIITINSNYSMTPADRTILADTTSGNVTITWNPGMDTKIRHIKNIGNAGNSVIITPTSGNIDGSSTVSIVDGEALAVQSNLSNLYSL